MSHLRDITGPLDPRDNGPVDPQFAEIVHHLVLTWCYLHDLIEGALVTVTSEENPEGTLFTLTIGVGPEMAIKMNADRQLRATIGRDS